VIVYICSPYRGKGGLGSSVGGNVELAKWACRVAAEVGVTPIAPHLFLTRFLDDTIPAERAMGINCGLEILSICAEVWVIGDFVSEGMAAEIRAANREGVPVRRFKDPYAMRDHAFNGGRAP